ncbi:MAG: hypothetical protein NUV51_10950 [Sulfuricaulis sp.]|nr:hypothetical protein [Sulfuricaulis sp.]
MKANPINTRQGKRQFIRSLTCSVSKSVCAAVDQMPADWDGYELRELLAELFANERMESMRKNRRRMSAYRGARYNIGRV